MRSAVVAMLAPAVVYGFVGLLHTLFVLNLFHILGHVLKLLDLAWIYLIFDMNFFSLIKRILTLAWL